jgi:hypothetical protein
MLNLCLALVLLQDGLSAEAFEKLHKELQPPKDEAWMSVPWKINLLEARDLAVVQKKPILIWSMDGNPLAAG